MCGTCPTAPAQSEIIHLYSFGGPRLRQLSFYKSLRRRRRRIPCVLEPLLYPPLDNQMAFKIFYIYSSPFEERLLRFSCQQKRESQFSQAHPKATRARWRRFNISQLSMFFQFAKRKKTSPWLMQIKKANSISLFIYLMHPLSALCSTACLASL
jgi:hypothetical protein